MELKPGYKKTEVGVIPEDWDVLTVGDHNPFVTSGSRGWAKFYSDRGEIFLRITNLTRECIFLDLSDLKHVQLSPNDTEGLRTQLQDGDLLISITADIGIVGYIDPNVPKPAYINQHIALVRLDPKQTDSKYLGYFLASDAPQRAFKSTTDQGAKAGMSLAGVRSIKAAFPPLPEQQAIAAALSDVDALMVSLNRMIEKKRDMKQATMQELLTGERRMPGFSGEWEHRPLKDYIQLISGCHVLAHYCNSDGQGIPYLTGPADFPEGKIQHTKFTTKPTTLCNQSDILVTVKGSGSGSLVLADGVYCISRQLMAIRVHRGDRLFIYYSLLGNASQIKAASTGLIPGLSRSDILEQLLPLPADQTEQIAIATILSDMDAEIAALERKRDKTRMIKQGMMQELLTGRVRLV